MSAIAVQIADDVVSLLNGAAADTFDEDFTAERKFIPTLTLEAAKCAVVNVIVPPANEEERLSRGEWNEECPIAVGVLKKLTGSCESERDPLGGIHISRLTRFRAGSRRAAQEGSTRVAHTCP